MFYKVAICDDDNNYLSYIKELLIKWSKLKNYNLDIETFNSSESFLFKYEEDNTFDILLLDIEMGKINGVELAKEIRKNNELVQIIFITGYSSYILDGYDVNALNYLIKPLDENKLFNVLDKASIKIASNEKTIDVDISGELIRIPLYEIMYIEVNRNYVTIHAKCNYTLKSTLSKFASLDEKNFVKVGRSYIINLNYITRVSKQFVHLKNNEKIILPRGMYEVLNKKIISNI